jgi:acyl-CoA thioesterase-1
MLRGIRLAETRANLDAILSEVRGRNIPVLLTGMRAIRNSEPRYLQGFEAIFPELAAKHEVALYPFFLNGVALVEGMTLADGMHPNFRGVKIIVTGIIGPVKAALGR